MSFTLKKDGTDYQFDLQGNVFKSGNSFGKWSVNDSNNVIIKSKAMEFKVGWSFIDNQLWLVLDGVKSFNFHQDQMPDYEIKDNLLQVRPNVLSSDFFITLKCKFNVDKNLNLLVTIDNIQSVLVGILEDTYGRFLFKFVDQVYTTQDVLILKGDWKKDVAVEGEIRLKFCYMVGNETHEIAIPKAFEVDKCTNSIRLRYEKQGSSRYLELGGEVQFKNNYTLVFKVKQRGATTSNEIEFNVQLSGAGSSLKSLEFTILKSNGEKGNTIEIGGALTAAVGKNGLTINFRYAQNTGSNNLDKKVQIAVDGCFSTSNGSIIFSYKKDGTATTIAIGLQNFKLGDIGVLSGKFQVTVDGKNYGVRGMIGLVW